MSEPELFASYRSHYQAAYGLPSVLSPTVLQFGRMGELLQTFTRTQLEDALEGFFADASGGLVSKRHPLAFFLADPSRWMPVQKAKTSTLCPHDVTCRSFNDCRDLILAEARRARA